VNVNTTAAQSRLCDPCGVGPGCRLPPVFLNRNRTEFGPKYRYRYSTCRFVLCGPCAFVRPRVPCVSRLPPVSFYRYSTVQYRYRYMCVPAPPVVFLPVHMCVPAPPGVFLPVHVL
jgi:hypothetical protein